jgi:predicted dinucleotide-binding enzyme
VLEETYAHLQKQLAGKVVIEASNPWGISAQGGIVSTLDGETAGTHTARLLPESKVARAFNHVMSELIITRGKRHPLDWAVAIAADDPDALAMTKQLVHDAGYVPVHVGSLAESAILDPGGEFMPHLYLPYDMERKLTDK